MKGLSSKELSSSLHRREKSLSWVAIHQLDAEDVRVGAATELELHDRDSVEPDRSKALGQRGWVHLLDEELHRASAAAVSLW